MANITQKYLRGIGSVISLPFILSLWKTFLLLNPNQEKIPTFYLFFYKRKEEKNKSGKRKEGRFILKKKHQFYKICKLTMGVLCRTSTEIKKVEIIFSYKLLLVYSDHLLRLNYQLLDWNIRKLLRKELFLD